MNYLYKTNESRAVVVSNATWKPFEKSCSDE